MKNTLKNIVSIILTGVIVFSSILIYMYDNTSAIVGHDCQEVIVNSNSDWLMRTICIIFIGISALALFTMHYYPEDEDGDEDTDRVYGPQENKRIPLDFLTQEQQDEDEYFESMIEEQALEQDSYDGADWEGVNTLF